jgi:hypothetical protein
MLPFFGILNLVRYGNINISLGRVRGETPNPTTPPSAKVCRGGEGVGAAVVVAFLKKKKLQQVSENLLNIFYPFLLLYLFLSNINKPSNEATTSLEWSLSSPPAFHIEKSQTRPLFCVI